MNNFITNNQFSDFNNSSQSNTIMSSERNYDSFVIKPPAKALTHGNRYAKLVIDSRQRDTIKFPNPSSYTFTLEEEYIDVTSAELIAAQIPNSFFNINEQIIETIRGPQNNNNGTILYHGKPTPHIKQQGNNILYIQIEGIDYVVPIPPGHYTEQTLMDCLNQLYGKLNNFIDINDPNTKISFKINPINQRVNIISTVEFKYNFNYVNFQCSSYKCSNIDQVLGFDSHIYDSKIMTYILSKTAAFPIKCSENSIEYNFEHVYVIKKVDFFMYDGTYAKLNWNLPDDHSETFTSTIYILKYSSNYLIFYFVNPTIVPIKSPDSTYLCINVNTIEYHYVIGDNAININCMDYFILDIPEFHLLHSNTKPIWNSFTLIPTQERHCKTVLRRGYFPNETDTKYFNPPLARLKDIHINITDFDGRLYNFNGKDHYLMFKIVCLNQSQKYNNYIPP